MGWVEDTAEMKPLDTVRGRQPGDSTSQAP